MIWAENNDDNDDEGGDGGFSVGIDDDDNDKGGGGDGDGGCDDDDDDGKLYKVNVFSLSNFDLMISYFNFFFLSRTWLRKDMFNKHCVFKKLLQPTKGSLLRVKPMWMHR